MTALVACEAIRPRLTLRLLRSASLWIPCQLGVGYERAGLAGFLASDGVGDWVVLHGGATAVFRVGSLREAARLAEAIAEVPGLEGSGALLTTRMTASPCG